MANYSSNIRFDPQMTFPEKLFLVANDDYLVNWTHNGESVAIQSGLFEEEVMTHYPGFLQKSSFANVRRLFREYGFEWNRVKKKLYIFWHPYFKQFQPNLIGLVKTKRKSRSNIDNHARRSGAGFDIDKYFLQLAKGETVTEYPPERPDPQPDIVDVPNTYEAQSFGYQTFCYNGEVYEDIPPNIGFESHTSGDLSYIRDSLMTNEFINVNENGGDFSLSQIEDEQNAVLEPVQLSKIPEDCCLKAGCFTIETKVGNEHMNSTVESCVSVKPPEWPCPCIQAYLSNISNPSFNVKDDSQFESIQSFSQDSSSTKAEDWDPVVYVDM